MSNATDGPGGPVGADGPGGPVGADGPGGTVLGVGTDLVEVSRLSAALERTPALLHRLFTPAEQARCNRNKDPLPHLAARFAAKEAVSKCFTTGIGAELSWKSISIYHGERSEPLVRLDEQGQALLAQVGGTDVRVSLSHTETVAMAVAAIVKA